MESLIYSNFLTIQPLTKEEKQQLENTLIHLLSLFHYLKKIKPSIFVLLITFFLIFNITTVNAALKQGDQNNDVISLQQKLQQLGYFQGKVTGYFGTQTELAVKRFQVAKNLSPDGIAGSITLSALNNNHTPVIPNSNLSNNQGLKKGDQSNEVMALQQKLQQLGYFQGKITGYFGSQTESALKKFQLANKLNPDGVAGRNTLNILTNTSTYNSPNSNSSFNSHSNNNSANQTLNSQSLKNGDRGNEVMALQQKLQQLGYFQGKITGYFGSQTEAALKQFQNSQNLVADGIAGRNTLAVLSGSKISNSQSNITINQPKKSSLNPSISLNTNQIKTIQDQLKNIGYYQGAIDGVYGATTHNSLIKFQTDHNLNHTNRMLTENFQNYSSSFGSRFSSISQRHEQHQGLDFAAPIDSYITNWRTGIVTELSDHTACGTLVRIQSGNFEQVYCHLKGSIKTDSNGAYLSDPGSGLNIRKGQTIATGARIGRVGMTGRTTGPHLHWGLKYQGTFIDPFLVLLR